MTKLYNFLDIDKQAFFLIELPVSERAGLVWIHPIPGATMDLDQFLGFVGDDLDHFGLNEFVRYRRSRVIKEANWKLLIKTYLEGYHVPYFYSNTLSHAFRKGVIAHHEYGLHIRLAAVLPDDYQGSKTQPSSLYSSRSVSFRWFIKASSCDTTISVP